MAGALLHPSCEPVLGSAMRQLQTFKRGGASGANLIQLKRAF